MRVQGRNEALSRRLQELTCTQQLCGQRGKHGRAGGGFVKREARSVWGRAKRKAEGDVQYPEEMSRWADAGNGWCVWSRTVSGPSMQLALARPGGIGLLTGRNSLAWGLPAHACLRAKRPACSRRLKLSAASHLLPFPSTHPDHPQPRHVLPGLLQPGGAAPPRLHAGLRHAAAGGQQAGPHAEAGGCRGREAEKVGRLGRPTHGGWGLGRAALRGREGR